MRENIFYIKILFLLNLLTPILALSSLNRLRGIIFDFPYRVYFEHFLSGFYAPLIFLFLLYSFTFLSSFFSKKEVLYFKRKTEIILLILTSVLYILFEFWWQFLVSYNSDSVIQFCMGLFGTFFLWGFLSKLSSIHNTI